MARRRLGPPRIGGGIAEEVAAGPAAAPAPAAPFPPAARMPPIARIAGQTAAEAALATLADDLRRARDAGRMVQELPLDAVDAHHLVRDRLVAEDDEMAALEQSLRERGQQVPVEVVDLGPAAAPRYGLISGWRRLTALRRLAAADPARPATVLAVLRRPESAAEAYRAMVEENEIRVGLSYYERARIAARAVGQGVFPDLPAALAGLFGTASRAKRSKIGSFVRLHEALDDRLRFAAAIPERLGLDLARALEDRGFAARLRDRLRKTPAADAGAERAALARALREAGRAGRAADAAAAPGGDPRPAPAVTGPDAGLDPGPGLTLRLAPGRIEIAGPRADAALARALAGWLRTRG